MNTGKPKLSFMYTSLLFIACCSVGISSFPVNGIKEKPVSYKEIFARADSFVAITNDGRIDWISDKGTVIKSKSIEGEAFHTVTINNLQMVVAGISGALYFFDNDTTFMKIETGTKSPANCLALFNGKVIAGYDNGELRIGNTGFSFKTVRIGLKGNIISLSVTTKECYGVTDQGEIIHTNDGTEWTTFDFNKIYNGYYNSCSFTKIITTPGQIAVIGKDINGLPVLFFSSKGTVWTQRLLTYTDEKGFIDTFNDITNDIYYDSSKEQFIMACNNGKLMTIPSCSHCNKLYNITDKNLNGISGNEHVIIIVGEENYIKIIDADIL